MKNSLKTFMSDEGRFVPRRARFFLQMLIPLATAAYSAYSANQASKQQKAGAINPEDQDTRSPEKRQMDQFLANFVNQYGSQYQPGKAYDKPLTAPESPYERQGLEQFLTQYLNAPNVSPGLTDVQSFLNKTVNGGYDPKTSDYYQAFRDEAQRTRGKAVDQANADLGARGKFFASEAAKKYADIETDTANSLNTASANLADKERTRSMAAVPQSAALEEYISKIPLEKAQAATTVGSLPRLLEQNDLEALYQDFKRRQTEGADVIGKATGVSNSKVEQGYPLPTLYPNSNPQQNDVSSFIQKLMVNQLPKLLSSFGG